MAVSRGVYAILRDGAARHGGDAGALARVRVLRVGPHRLGGARAGLVQRLRVVVGGGAPARVAHHGANIEDAALAFQVAVFQLQHVQLITNYDRELLVVEINEI